MKTFRELLEDIDKSLGYSSWIHDPKSTIKGAGEYTKKIKEAENEAHDKVKLSPGEHDAVHGYIGAHQLKGVKANRAGYHLINGLHRGNIDITDMHSFDRHKVIEHSDNLDSAINKHTTNHELHVWRGLSSVATKGLGLTNHMGMIPKDIEGKVIHDKGFVSTTTSPDYTKYFGGDQKAHIIIPKGSKALSVNLHIKPPNNDNDEHEVILPRGSKFKHLGVTHHEDGLGYKTIVHHLEHIPEN